MRFVACSIKVQLHIQSHVKKYISFSKPTNKVLFKYNILTNYLTYACMFTCTFGGRCLYGGKPNKSWNKKVTHRTIRSIQANGLCNNAIKSRVVGSIN